LLSKSTKQSVTTTMIQIEMVNQLKRFTTWIKEAIKSEMFANNFRIV